MKESIRTYLKKYYAFDALLGDNSSTTSENVFNKFRLSPGKRFMMQLLKLSPYICAFLFLGNLGIQLLASEWVQGLISAPGIKTFYTDRQVFLQALLTISVSGLIGYGTNYIAIRMLFRPVTPRPIWGQGLIPAQRNRIIYTLAQGMHKHVLNQDLIRKRIEDSGIINKLTNIFLDGSAGLLQDEALRKEIKSMLYDTMTDFAKRENFQAEVRKAIDTRLDKKIDGGIQRIVFNTYKRFNQNEYEQAITNIIEEIPTVAMEVIQKLEGEINEIVEYLQAQKPATEEGLMQIIMDILYRIDITQILAKQMEHFDEAKLEKMVWEATNEQLLYIQYLGTILGVLGGFLIWQPLVMGGIYIVSFGALYLLDVMILNLREKKNKEIIPAEVKALPQGEGNVPATLEAVVIEKKEELELDKSTEV